MEKIKFGIMGCGNFGSFVGRAWKQGLLADYELIGCFDLFSESAKRLAEEVGCVTCQSMEELLELQPAYIVEATNPACVKEYAETILTHGCNLILLSMGVFADDTFKNRIAQVAKENGRKVHIASGAIGGFDILRTCAAMGIKGVTLTNEKDVKYLRDNELYKPEMEHEIVTALDGTAQEAIAVLPTGINLGVATALASGGLEGTRIVIKSVPSQAGERFIIQKGDVESGVSVCLDVFCGNRMLPAWSVISLMQNLTSPICV